MVEALFGYEGVAIQFTFQAGRRVDPENLLPNEIVYEKTSSIPEGTEVIKQTGKKGYKCSTYRILYQGGKQISKTLLSTDTYKPQKQIVQTNK